MSDGNIVVNLETVNALGEKVLEGSAEVSQPITAYVFTRQGSQEPGMGMDLYNTSPAARAVWDGADEHLRAVYGFSILEIVKDNPNDKTVHFGGINGQAIRQRYMDIPLIRMAISQPFPSSRTSTFVHPSIPSVIRTVYSSLHNSLR